MTKTKNQQQSEAAHSAPKVSLKDPRKIKVGDVVRVTQPDGTWPFEAVRGVELLLHLGNGVDVIVPIDTEIRVATTLTPELKEKVAALQLPK